MHIEQRQDGIFVCHRVNTEKVLVRFKMHEANPIATPCDRSSSESQFSFGSRVPHRKAVGCFKYLIEETCPDIAFAVSQAA
jgi:hypothetical protein